MREMLKGMITEQEPLKIMRPKPSELAYLRREKGLPYVKLSIRRRVYLEDDLMECFKSLRTTAESSGSSTHDSSKPYATDADEEPQTHTNAYRGLEVEQ